MDPVLRGPLSRDNPQVDQHLGINFDFLPDTVASQRPYVKCSRRGSQKGPGGGDAGASEESRWSCRRSWGRSPDPFTRHEVVIQPAQKPVYMADIVVLGLRPQLRCRHLHLVPLEGVLDLRQGLPLHLCHASSSGSGSGSLYGLEITSVHGCASPYWIPGGLSWHLGGLSWHSGCRIVQ